MVTFDFDETLTRPIWDSKHRLIEPSENPNYDSFDRLRGFHQQGQEIRIVTTRWCNEEIVDFVEKYSLPISEIHCTQGKLKGDTLLKLRPELHFDDSEDEAINNKILGIKTIILSYHFDTEINNLVCQFKFFK